MTAQSDKDGRRDGARRAVRARSGAAVAGARRGVRAASRGRPADPPRRDLALHGSARRAGDAAPLAAAPDAARGRGGARRLAALARSAPARLVLLDGRFVAALSDPPPAGVGRRRSRGACAIAPTIRCWRSTSRWPKAACASTSPPARSRRRSRSSICAAPSAESVYSRSPSRSAPARAPSSSSASSAPGPARSGTSRPGSPSPKARRAMHVAADRATSRASMSKARSAARARRAA